MFGFIKQLLIALLCFSGSLATKCISLINQPCITRTTLIDLNPDELSQWLYYYLFMVTLGRWDGSCSTLHDLPRRLEYVFRIKQKI